MQNKNRVIFTFIAVILLISLGFNGYFVNQKIKDQRQSDIDWGKDLILSYYDATMFAGIIRDATEGILSSDTVEQRLSYKYQVGIAYRFTESLPKLIAGAETINGEPFTQMQQHPLHFFTELNNALGSIASHNGELTDDEMMYLQTTQELFVEVVDLLSGYEIENTADHLALEMIKGGPWVGIVEQINNLFADAPEFLFTYRSTQD